jgi:hypothetical protein
MLLLILTMLAFGEDISSSETSYTGATILQGDTEVVVVETLNIDYEIDPNTYAFFEGNSLYVGTTDDHENSVDGIIEFFWFHSSIDRGSDFYVAVIKVRSSPGNDCFLSDCRLWADEYQDWGEYPVVGVEAITDITREQGAFRWDWAVPFENYGIDAYGQMTFSNQYGIGASAEGSAMTGVAIPEGTNLNGIPVEGTADVQVKGYVSPEYSVRTQYNVTLYEWDVFVNGRADLMSWDVFLNIGERDDQSAYHEFFLAIQVEEGKTFMLDELNLYGNFDTGWWNPINTEVGISLQGLGISQPNHEPDTTEPSTEPSTEPASEPAEEPAAEPSTEQDTDLDESPDESFDLNESRTSTPTKSGCSSVNNSSSWFWLISAIILIRERKKTT